jgi:BirA family transcriptional regulator, biotin operon repressor / biotin---[acetyl-CoA-carboxylase] ligase
VIDFTIIEHSFIDSTNNYAMQLIDANKALHGMTITALSQTAGKGQRGKNWVDSPGKSLLMSIIVNPIQEIQEQFSFNASIASAIANILQKLNNNWTIHIKWPNDIIINDKKAGGILIENILRGSKWTHSVIGLGLNVNQEGLPGDLPYATSLFIESGEKYLLSQLRDSIHDAVMNVANFPLGVESAMATYNKMLFKRGKMQRFNEQSNSWEVQIIGVHSDGRLEIVGPNGNTEFYFHGQYEWCW